MLYHPNQGFPALVVKNLPANADRRKRLRFNPWVGKIPWRRAQKHILVFCLENSLKAAVHA